MTYNYDIPGMPDHWQKLQNLSAQLLGRHYIINSNSYLVGIRETSALESTEIEKNDSL